MRDCIVLLRASFRGAAGAKPRPMITASFATVRFAAPAAAMRRESALARLPLFAALFRDFYEPRARKRLIDMAWTSAKLAEHAVVPTLPLA